MVEATGLYMGAPNATWPDDFELVAVPSGSDSINITFTLSNGDVVKLLRELGVQRVSDAAIMDEWIRESHRMPDVRDTKLLRDMNVTYFGMGYNRMGYYKITYMDFADGSSYEHGVVYD